MIVPSACNEANKGDIAKVVLMPGDPLRAKYVAENYLENPVCFNTVRNMFGYTGTYKGKKISVMGSGMGIPSMGLYAYELYNFFDVDSIIRIGSAGGICDSVKLRDVVIAMGASTNSGFASQYNFPGTFAPMASFSLLRNAVDAAERIKVNAVVGPVFTADQFYNADETAASKYREMGILALEMETAGLYMTAAKAGKQALSILTISDLVFTGEGLSAADRQNSFTDMMEIALETAWKSID
ncbi:MAG: purine-nucleoside phosphorylase [Clostridiales bacterium]|jgi:purine-nucleoside phosphorylase|nr:purine-nucleoside phosphorylase [Clostridiales bacterium]